MWLLACLCWERLANRPIPVGSRVASRERQNKLLHPKSDRGAIVGRESCVAGGAQRHAGDRGVPCSGSHWLMRHRVVSTSAGPLL